MAELFKTASREVIRYLDERRIEPSWRWNDWAAHEHALARTVARTIGFDVVKDIQDAMSQAIAERRSLEDFKRELTPILQAKGWWRKKAVTNPDGKTEVVQLGSARRLETIYWANTASAHAAGEWARTQATKDVLPYLQYKVSLSERKRPEHLGWVGTTLPVDHPWWRTHYPPNGWRCKCRVEQIGDYRAEQVPPEKRRAPPLNPKIWRDKRTGKTWRVPEGIDPGWQRNPGRTREVVAAAERRRAIRAAAAPDAGPAERVQAARVIVAQMRRTPEFEAIAGNALGKPWPWAGKLSDADRAWQRLRAPVAVLDEANAGRLGLPPATVVELTGHDAPKMAVKHGVGVAEWELAQTILDGFDAVLLDRGKWVYVKLIEGKPWMLVVKATAEGETFANSFHRCTPRQYEAIVEKAQSR